jgi:hypothetical protein
MNAATVEENFVDPDSGKPGRAVRYRSVEA